MRVWTSLATLLILHLQLCYGGYVRFGSHPCEDGYVCAIFVLQGVWCYKGYNGEWDKNRDDTMGFYWESDATTKCGGPWLIETVTDDFGSYYAGISIKPESKTKWSVNVHISNRNVPKDITFDFGNATLTFPGMNDYTIKPMKTVFTWKEDGVVKGSSVFEPTYTKDFTTTYLLGKTYTIYEYLYQIEAQGKHLINFFSDEVKFIITTIEEDDPGNEMKRTRTMKDKRFLDFLEFHNSTKCKKEEVISRVVCFDCDEITDNDGTKNETEEVQLRRASYGPLNCPSTAWIHNTDDMFIRSWESFDYITCEKGIWYAKWTNKTDSKKIDSSVELHCSSNEPATWTQTMSLTIGIGGAALIIIIVAVVGLVIMWQLKARKAKRSDSQTNSHGTTSKAVTPSAKATYGKVGN